MLYYLKGTHYYENIRHHIFGLPRYVSSKLLFPRHTASILTLFRKGFFGAAHEWMGPFCPLPKIRHTYPTMMKLGTIIPYLRKIQKMYHSHDASLEFCKHQHFFSRKQQILLYQKIKI